MAMLSDLMKRLFHIVRPSLCYIFCYHHVLHPLLPDRNQHGYELRCRRHDRTLTSNDDKRNFIYRQVHKYSY